MTNVRKADALKGPATTTTATTTAETAAPAGRRCRFPFSFAFPGARLAVLFRPLEVRKARKARLSGLARGLREAFGAGGRAALASVPRRALGLAERRVNGAEEGAKKDGGRAPNPRLKRALPPGIRQSARVLLLGAAAGTSAILGAAALLTASGALFLKLFSLDPLLARPWTLLSYWEAYAGGSVKLRAAILVCGVLPWAVAGGMLYAALREKERPLHGDARFATRAEVRRSGVLFSRIPPQAILVGRLGSEFLALTGSRFALLAAPTRSGKGVGVVIPNCLAFSDSLVVLDIKEENFDLTSRCRKEILGNDVFLFSPFAADGRTHRWNPLDAVSPDPVERIGDIDAIAASLYSGFSEKDRFWSESAKDLFRGLALLVLETEGIPHTMGEILRKASGEGKSLKDRVKELTDEAAAIGRPFTRACRDSLARVLSTSENTFTSILATFNVPMQAFQNPRVDAATSATSPGLDLAAVRRRPITVYLGVPPDRLGQARVIVNLFFDQLISRNTRALPSQDPALRYQCLLLMDEFTAAGRIPMIAQAVSYMAGYGLRLLTIIQNKSQLEDVYGRAQSVTLRANHAMSVIFAPSPAVIEDAREASELLGYATVKGRSRSRPLGVLGKSGSESVSEQRRALLLPQELRELGADREVIALENAKPVLARKIRYYEDPVLKARLLGSIRDELPRIDAAAYGKALETQALATEKERREAIRRAPDRKALQEERESKRRQGDNPLRTVADPEWDGARPYPQTPGERMKDDALGHITKGFPAAWQSARRGR